MERVIVRRLAIGISALSIVILWASWALNNDLVERGWLNRGEPTVVTLVGLIFGVGAWVLLARPWEREQRTPHVLPLAEELRAAGCGQDPSVPAPGGTLAADQRRSPGRATIMDLVLLLASVMLLVAAIGSLPRVAEGLRSIW